MIFSPSDFLQLDNLRADCNQGGKKKAGWPVNLAVRVSNAG